MLKKIIRIATRKSPLALWQAQYVKKKLLNLYNYTLEIKIIPILTAGDKHLNITIKNNIHLHKSFFTKELEDAITNNYADIAVHSMKDVPNKLPKGLGLVSVCKRENPYDAFVSNDYASINDLPKSAIIGTSSIRRQFQLNNYRSDLITKTLRGNVETRLKKLDLGKYDAIILAVSGLKRLGKEKRIKEILPIEFFLPCAGQGAIGIESRLSDIETVKILRQINDKKTACCVLAERSMNNYLGTGCQSPTGSFAIIKNKKIWLRGFIGSVNNKKIIFDEKKGPLNQPIKVGINLAKKLIKQGAHKILHEHYL
ncbi:hydroxymethylbilane synthase [Candidatus Tachikawaea gelatinosa]|uniref:Porphobilinogen deaminase n=1 Tax=Candidatus Tachikawaea gelatinosa TaxID=1410383 RepID=A0A090AL92_9ENTR|nr:hydroxymethylbilane synthase [Candidatus Tachikawaea gelatinosa]BAP58384.1 porphobilinogen deaminase [Candidatus Tachikawaea gelatinosa]